MKTLVKLLVFVTALGLHSCSNDFTDERPKNDTPEGIEVPIVFSGDIEVSESPLSRTATSTDDLIGIQVYRREAGTNNSWNPFAYGLFDHLDNISVNLQKGYEYKVEATLVKDGKNKLYYNNYDGYGRYYPFYIGKAQSIFVANKLVIDTRYYFSFLSNIRTTPAGSTSYVDKYPKVDRLYGVIEGIMPTDNTQINLDLKRVSFGINCSVDGLEEGSLNVRVYNSSKDFFNLSNVGNGYSTSTDFYTFTNMIDGAYNHLNSYYEEFDVSVSHKHDIINITEDLGSVKVKVYRNKINNIKINLNATTSRSGSSNNKVNVIVEQENIE